MQGFVWGGKLSKGKAKAENGEGYDLIILSDLVFNHSQVSLMKRLSYQS